MNMDVKVVSVSLKNLKNLKNSKNLRTAKGSVGASTKKNVFPAAIATTTLVVVANMLSVVIPVLVAVLAIAAPATARPLDPLTPIEMHWRLLQLQHAPWNHFVNETDVERDGRCIHSQLSLHVGDPVVVQTRQISVHHVRPDLPQQKVPLIIIVPTIEGASTLEEVIQNKLCNAGMASVVADVNADIQPTELPGWGHEDRNGRSSVLALRTILDWAEDSSRFDQAKLGMIGLSLGGITTALMAGVEPERLRAVVITVGGGNVPFILATSDNDKVSLLRERRMKFLNYQDVTRYEEDLRRSVTFDPFYFASLANKDRILMIMAKTDTKVPTLVQKELHEAFGRPESMIFNRGHVDAIVSMTFFHMGEVIQFMKTRFDGTKGLSPLAATTTMAVAPE